MKIALFTNTYLPHVGGVARSVNTLEEACRKMGHEVRVIAPEFEDAEPDDNVLRVPAFQHFNGSDFSVRIPLPNVIGPFIEEFQPDIIHSHHPFLLGDAALRAAWKLNVPIAFTHHTLYERYTHYVPLDSPALKRVAIQLATEYCNLCDAVIAPSQSIADLLLTRGVETPISPISTGIHLDFFAAGNGSRFRKEHGIAKDARVIGLVGRLAKEKNLSYLAEAVGPCLKKHSGSVFLLVGQGDALDEVLSILHQYADESQIHVVGNLVGTQLADAYAALDWFVFASQTETQGIVLAEAMAVGKPVIALDGPGVREIVKDGHNGLLLPSDAPASEFTAAIERMMNDKELSASCSKHARQSAEEYGVEPCTQKVLNCYANLIAEHERNACQTLSGWDSFMMSIETEWELLTAKIHALNAAINGDETETEVETEVKS